MIYEVLFPLLRRALGFAHDNDAMPEDIDWNATITMLREHAMLAVAADAILSLPEKMRPDARLQIEILQYSAAVTRMHHTLNNAVCDVFCAMYDAGLHPVLLKGQGLATLYPKPFIRGCGDIDLYLKPDEFEHGCRIIFDYCGVSPSTPIIQLPDNIHQTAHKGECVKYEIHYLMADTAIADIKDEYNQWISHTSFNILKMDRVMINGMHIGVLPMQTNVVFVFEHLLKHLRSGGVGLRQFVDWMLLLHDAASSKCSNRIDHGQLRRDLKRFHLLDAWQVLGGILVWQLGLPKSEFPLWDERKARYSQGRNIEYIVCAGNFGSTLPEYKGYYTMPPSLKRDLLALKYAWKYQRFMYHLMPYDTPNKVWNDIIRVTKNAIKRML